MAGDERARSVLCVQPNVEARRAIRLGLSDCAMTVVGTGLDALRALNATPFDAYLISYWLPDWSGLSLCREIRKADPHVPIGISADQNENHEARTLRAGADVYFHGSDWPERVPKKFAALLNHSDARCAMARVEERRVLAEEIRRRVSGGSGAPGAWAQSSIESLERTARARASAAYIAAGGTLARFNREWQSTFAAALAAEGVAIPDGTRDSHGPSTHG